MEDAVLQRFQRFKAMIISSNLPNNILLEMAESFITQNEDLPVPEISIMDGQLSLLDVA